LDVEAWCAEFDDAQFESTSGTRTRPAADDAFLFRVLAHESQRSGANDRQ
jgi:hypothetical protein